MKKKFYIAVFISIFIFGIFLRFYNLGKIPNSLNWDEVSWGYNAYSILTTGQDEYGNSFPLSFKAFGDYKQPVYVYLTSISIALFGEDAFAVRFPSAFFGSLSILFVWLFSYSLFYKDRRRDIIALVAMFLYAFSPWSIQFSRVAYEANIGLSFTIIGVALFIYGLVKRQTSLLFVSFIPLILSGYSYHSQKIFTPLFVIGLLVFAFIHYKLNRKILLLLLLFFILGSAFWVMDARTTARGRSVTFVSNQTQVLRDSAEKIIYDEKNNDAFGKLLHNRRIIYGEKYFENYLSHFDLNYLFIYGDDARHHAYGMGLLYLLSLPAIVIGIFAINKKKYWLVFLWLLLGPAASALAIDAPNASRSLITLPAWIIFGALGWTTLIFNLHKDWRKVILIILLVLFAANIIYYVHQYFYHTNSEYSKYWQHGYEEAVLIADKYSKEGKVFFSREYEQPYIFYLFHTKYSPQKYISNGGSNRIKEKCYSIESVYFGNCSSEYSNGDIIISMNEVRDEHYKKIEEIKGDRGIVVGLVYKYF